MELVIVIDSDSEKIIALSLVIVESHLLATSDRKAFLDVLLVDRLNTLVKKHKLLK